MHRAREPCFLWNTNTTLSVAVVQSGVNKIRRGKKKKRHINLIISTRSLTPELSDTNKSMNCLKVISGETEFRNTSSRNSSRNKTMDTGSRWVVARWERGGVRKCPRSTEPLLDPDRSYLTHPTPDLKAAQGPLCFLPVCVCEGIVHACWTGCNTTGTAENTVTGLILLGWLTPDFGILFAQWHWTECSVQSSLMSLSLMGFLTCCCFSIRISQSQSSGPSSTLPHIDPPQH